MSVLCTLTLSTASIFVRYKSLLPNKDILGDVKISERTNANEQTNQPMNEWENEPADKWALSSNQMYEIAWLSLFYR